ncbi:hypothetical protein Q9233_001935 [Columba guinea]|nr:hypothetical protein Q9233_001935 [Columba guinea]
MTLLFTSAFQLKAASYEDKARKHGAQMAPSHTPDSFRAKVQLSFGGGVFEDMDGSFDMGAASHFTLLLMQNEASTPESMAQTLLVPLHAQELSLYSNRSRTRSQQEINTSIDMKASRTSYHAGFCEVDSLSNGRAIREEMKMLEILESNEGGSSVCSDHSRISLANPTQPLVPMHLENKTEEFVSQRKHGNFRHRKKPEILKGEIRSHAPPTSDDSPIAKTNPKFHRGSVSSCLLCCQTGKLEATCESGGDKMTSNCLTAKDPILGIVPVYPAKYALAEECVVAWEGGSKLFPAPLGMIADLILLQPDKTWLEDDPGKQEGESSEDIEGQLINRALQEADRHEVHPNRLPE